MSSRYIVYLAPPNRPCQWCIHMTKLVAVLKTVRPDLNVESNWFSTYERGNNSIVPAIYDQSTNRIMQGEEAFDFVLSLMCQRPSAHRPQLYGASAPVAHSTIHGAPPRADLSQAVASGSKTDPILVEQDFGEHVKANERKLSPECMAKLFPRA